MGRLDQLLSLLPAARQAVSSSGGTSHSKRGLATQTQAVASARSRLRNQYESQVKWSSSKFVFCRLSAGDDAMNSFKFHLFD